MSEAVLPAPGPADVQPVAHETARPHRHRARHRRSDARARRRRVAVLAGLAQARGPDHLRCLLRPHRPGRDGRASIGCSRTAASRPSRQSRGTLAILGSIAIEGPVISWVADHRKHHAFSDRPAIRTARTSITAAACAGRCAASCTRTSAGCSCTTSAAPRARYAPDLLPDPVIRFVDRTFVLWALGGLVLPFVLGLAIGGTLAAGLTALLWGGPCGCSSCTTSPTASTRSATSSAAGGSRPRTSRATCSGSRCRRSASPGTTTTTRSRPRPSTACVAGSSTRRRSSSAASRRPGWPGTSCA